MHGKCSVLLPSNEVNSTQTLLQPRMVSIELQNNANASNHVSVKFYAVINLQEGFFISLLIGLKLLSEIHLKICISSRHKLHIIYFVPPIFIFLCFFLFFLFLSPCVSTSTRVIMFCISFCRIQRTQLETIKELRLQEILGNKPHVILLINHMG